MFNNIKRKRILISKYDGIDKIEIKKGHNYKGIYESIKQDNSINNELKKKIIGSILKYNPDVINEDIKVLPLDIYLMDDDNKTYEIIKENDDNFIVSRKNYTNQNIEEISLEFMGSNFKIDKITHTLNGSTKDIETYSIDNNDYINNLSKNKAFTYAKTLLDDICTIDKIKNIIDVNLLYKKLNIITKDKYNPVISDDKISLCTIKKEDNILDKKSSFFSIVLNDTKEVVGDISYNYMNEGPSELGNVMYNVKEKYRHNGYCTRALSLLIKLLKNNTYNGNKDLYLATINEYSMRVAKRNGGILYNGEYKDLESKDLENDLSDENDNEVELFKIGI